MNIPVDPVTSTELRKSAVLCLRLEYPSGDASLDDFIAGLIVARTHHHRGAIIGGEKKDVWIEFAEAPDAVNCAIDLLDRLQHLSRQRAEGARWISRAGIDFGDLYYSEAKTVGMALTGARGIIELSPDGGIVISRDLQQKIRFSLDLQYESLGKKVLASVPDPRELFLVNWKAIAEKLQATLKRLDADHLHRISGTDREVNESAKRKKPAPTLVLALIILIVVILRWLGWL
jgi:hypothetical protein